MADYFIIQLHIYPFDIMVSLDESDDVLKKRIDRVSYASERDYEQLLNMADTVNGRCVMLQGNQTVIRLKKLLKRHDMAAVISHEVFHAVTFIMDRVGAKLELMVSDESYAYLVGYITREIHKRIKL